MNLINRMIVSESNPKLNINGTVKGCECEECTNGGIENQTVEYPPLSEEEIEQIIKERYFNKDEKTKKFIRRVLRKYGDRYDYSNVVYVKATEHVEIICRAKGHKPFSITLDNHLHNRGCKLCGIKKRADEQRMTLKKFIDKSNKIHGEGTYDYSKIKFVDCYTDVNIICHNHDTPYEFPQAPYHHLEGHGCPKCKFEKLADLYKLTKEEFIENANKIHGVGTYDYSQVKYVNYQTEVIIICPKHGEFPQTPNTHIHGKSGCPKCKNNYKGEIIIRKFLTENKINFEEQKKFEDCKDIRCLPFDFYIPKYNLCIEHDRIQHFKPTKRSNKMTDEESKENLKYIQNHDQIKNNYCEQKGINLLRIRYDKNVKEKLAEYFQNL